MRSGYGHPPCRELTPTPSQGRRSPTPTALPESEALPHPTRVMCRRALCLVSWLAVCSDSVDTLINEVGWPCPQHQVNALRPESGMDSGLYSRKWVRERFWVVPTALLIAGMAVGLAVSRADSIPGVDRVGGGLRQAGSAEAILGIIAASMLAFVESSSRSHW